MQAPLIFQTSSPLTPPWPAQRVQDGRNEVAKFRATISRTGGGVGCAGRAAPSSRAEIRDLNDETLSRSR
jgi:hypothetical protein